MKRNLEPNHKPMGGRRAGAGRPIVDPINGPVKKTVIMLTQWHIAAAVKLGSGNMSRGVRLALDKENGNL